MTSSISAMALGAEILEFHVVFHKEMFGPDVSSSFTLDQVRLVVKARNELNLALSHPVDKTENSKFNTLKSIFEKSLAVNKELKKGHVISFNDLEAKKPKNYGIKANQFESVIGRSLKVDKSQWDFLKEDDLI
jgi:N-acetylneuraminate synthase